MAGAWRSSGWQGSGWAVVGAEQGWSAETAVNVGFACQLLSGKALILEEQDVR